MPSRLCFSGLIMAVILVVFQGSPVFAQTDSSSDIKPQTWAIHGSDGNRVIVLNHANEEIPDFTSVVNLFDWQSQLGSQGLGTAAPDAPQVDCTSIGTLTAPRLIVPANGSNLSTLIPSLQVEIDESMYASDSGLWLYVVISPVPDFSYITSYLAYIIRSGSYTPRITYKMGDNLDPARTYYWRAHLNCQAPGGTQGPYSSVWQFRTGSGGVIPSPAPSMLKPNANERVSLPIHLQWTEIGGATGYDLRITQGVMSYAISTTLARYSAQGSWVVPNLPYYSWRVRAFNSYAYGPWTTERPFRYGPYEPNPYGYGFENSKARVSWSIFRDTFGRSAVEYSNGTPRPLAQRYYDRTFRDIGAGGVCSGMAASSALLFRGWANPTDYLANRGVTNASNLNAPVSFGGTWSLGPVADFIVRYQGYQYGTEISNARRYYNLTNQQAIQRIVDSIDGGLVAPVLIGIRGWGGISCSFHMLTPFDYAWSGSSLIVWVYDSNHPMISGQQMIFTLSSSGAISWRYVHNNALGTWTSSHVCNSVARGLYVLPISLWQGFATPPWHTSSQRSSDDNQADMYVDLSVNGDAQLLITDDQGRALGYRNGQLVEEIPGSTSVLWDGAIPNLPINSVERYHIDADARFQISINYTNAGQATVDYFAPEAVVQVTGSSSNSGVSDTLSISEAANEVRLTAGATADDRSMSVLQQAETWANEATVFGFKLSSTDMAVVRFDPIETENVAVVFRSSTDDQEYGFLLRHSTAEGRNVGYYSGDIAFGQGDTHRLAVDWASPNTGLLEIDYGSDGTIDETVVLPNQLKSVFLPMVLGGQ